MKVRITVGKGVTGAVRYVMGPGKDAAAGLFPGGSDGPAGRVGWISGQGFGFQIKTFEQADLARRVMEFDARHQASKTKQCVYDCVHIVLAWERGEMPSRERMEEACRSQLKAQGMENAKAIFVAHNDEDYFHVHIGASKINPATGRVYDLAGSWRKASLWAEQYEREHGGVVTVNRQSANELRRAIKERDIEGVLEAMARRNATFTARQLERAVQKEIYPETGAADGKKHTVELERAQFVNAILAHESVLRLAKEHNGPVHCYTTRSIRDAETYVLNAAAGLKADTGHGIGEDKRAAVLAGKYGAMTAEQLHAFRHCTGDEGLALIDGQAGTGKSFTMAAIRDACEADGRHVVGLAFTNKVAKNLARDGFSHTATVHRALMDLNNGRTAWNAKTVVMVDEAAMLDTKLMAMLTAHAHDAGAKLILVGDDRQLSSIDCGGMFGVLKDRHGAAVLSEARRQYKPDEKRASEMMAEGNFDTALAIYDRKGAIHWTRTQKEAREELVEKWARDTAENNGKTRFVFAYCNIDVDALNAALRAVRKERGELEWEDHSIRTANGRFDFSAGDRVQFTGTNKRLGIDNADTGTIEMIEGEKLRVRLDGPERKIVEFEAGSFGHFRHGYAGTVWKGQGDTLDQTYLYHSEHWRSAPSYVALTRHRERTDLFVATNTAKDLAALAKQVARQDETRAASAFYQLDQIEPVRPMKAKEILAQFAGEQFRKAAERMQREARRWHERHYNPRPHPPWPSLRERLAPEWGDGDAIERLAVNENIRARMARRAQQREGNRPVDELWEEEKRKRRSGSAMDMDIRPRKPLGQQLGDEAPRYPAGHEIAGAAKGDEIQPEIIARLKSSEPERGGVPPDTPDRDRAEQECDSERGAAAAEILARQNNSQATYSVEPSQGGYAVFRTWNREDELVAQLDLSSSRQKLGAAPTLGELHTAIIDGSVFTADSEWVMDERIEQGTKPERTAVNQNERELDPFTQRLRDGFSSFGVSKPEPGRYGSLEPAAESLTAEAIARDHWNAVVLELPAAADPRLLFLVADTARGLHLKLSDRAGEALGVPDIDAVTRQQAELWSDLADRAAAREKEAQTLIRALNADTPLTREALDYDPWASVYQPIPTNADPALLNDAYGMAMQCAEAVAGPPGQAQHAFEPTILYGTNHTREENFEHAMRRVDELDARLQAVQQDLREFTLETIQADPWSAVHLEIPATADQELLKEAHATVVQCCQAVSRSPHPFDIYVPDNGQTPDRNFEDAARRLEELGGRLQAGLDPNEQAKLAEDILDWQDSEHSHYDIAPWQDGFAVFRIHEIEDDLPEEYRLPTGQQVLGWAETIDRLQDAIIDGSALIAPPEWIIDRQMAEAEERYMVQLAQAADDAWRAEASRQSSEEVPEVRYDRDTGERLSGGGSEARYDRDTGERIDSGGEERSSGRGLGGGMGSMT